jgi:hypothetical protein
LSTGSFLDLGIHPAEPATLFGSTVRSVYLHRTGDCGSVWSTVFTDVIGGGELNTAVLVLPGEPENVYVALGVRGIYHLGTGFINEGLPGSSIHPYISELLATGTTTNTLYAGLRLMNDAGGVYTRTVPGDAWFEANLGLVNRDVRALAIAANKQDTLFAGTAGGLFVSDDAAATWMPTSLWGATISAVVIHPNDHKRVFAASDNEVHRSSDGGVTWESVTVAPANRLLQALAVDPLAPETVYAGTDEGAYRSADGGTTWERLDADFDSDVRSLAFGCSAAAPRLYAATARDGIFVLTSLDQQTYLPVARR